MLRLMIAESNLLLVAAVRQAGTLGQPMVTVAYNKDPSLIKLNLGVGAYRTEEGKPLVLNVVRKAEPLLVNDSSCVKEYLPIVGLADFNKLSAKLIFGANSPLVQASVPALAGFLGASLSVPSVKATIGTYP